MLGLQFTKQGIRSGSSINLQGFLKEGFRERVVITIISQMPRTQIRVKWVCIGGLQCLERKRREEEVASVR
jgi:hypothetical protein